MCYAPAYVTHEFAVIPRRSRGINANKWVIAHNTRVIPNQFSKSLDATDSELDETWCVSSACGFMKPDKTSLLYLVWLPGYGPLKIPLFFNFSGSNSLTHFAGSHNQVSVNFQGA